MSLPSPRPVALVTGGARRVGACIARTLHAAGYDLALHYRHSSAQAAALLEELERERAGSTLAVQADLAATDRLDRKSTRLNSSHMSISYAVFCLKKKKNK